MADEVDEFHGKWFASDNDEEFCIYYAFDTRDAAEAHGREEFSQLSDGDVFYTGQAFRSTHDDVCEYEYRIEHIESHVFEQCKETSTSDKGLDLMCMRPSDHEGECDFV